MCSHSALRIPFINRLCESHNNRAHNGCPLGRDFGASGLQSFEPIAHLRDIGRTFGLECGLVSHDVFERGLHFFNREREESYCPDKAKNTCKPLPQKNVRLTTM